MLHTGIEDDSGDTSGGTPINVYMLIGLPLDNLGIEGVERPISVSSLALHLLQATNSSSHHASSDARPDAHPAHAVMLCNAGTCDTCQPVLDFYLSST